MIQHSVLALDGVTVTERRKALEKILSSARTSVYTAYFTQAVLIFFSICTTFAQTTYLGE